MSPEDCSRIFRKSKKDKYKDDDDDIDDDEDDIDNDDDNDDIDVNDEELGDEKRNPKTLLRRILTLTR